MPSWGRKSNGKFDSFQGLFERKQLRDQALVIGRGAHGVLENLVDRMNDFGNSNDFADCGWDRRHCKRWARARADFGVKYTLNIQGRMASMRQCTLQCPSAVTAAVQNFVRHSNFDRHVFLYLILSQAYPIRIQCISTVRTSVCKM